MGLLEVILVDIKPSSTPALLYRVLFYFPFLLYSPYRVMHSS